MAGRIACLVTLVLLAAAPAVSAHGDLSINELEVLAIRDFEGQEDSFTWEGFEIWDVYVGEGYSPAFDSDGVYFKVNFAGDGTSRPLESQAWTITFTFKVGDEAYERSITHDGVDVTTDFEELEWQIADGNVFQVRAWVPVPGWAGQSVTDIVLVSAVDGEPRDTAPGGIHAPGAGTEVPVQGPSTVIFPPLGEGRMVESVPLTGPQKFLNVSVASPSAGSFDVTVTNPLKEQGQHVMLYAADTPGWSIAPADWSASVEGGKSAAFLLAITATAEPGMQVDPLRLDLVTDIGGRQTYFAYLDAAQVALVQDPAMAQPGALAEPTQEAPALSLAPLIVALAVAVGLRSKGRAR